MSSLAIKPKAHIVDVLGNVIGRDQPILRMEKALEMTSLLGTEVFSDETVVFFDPFCKAGELLLACAFHSCRAKTISGHQLLDADTVYNEIFQSNRYFGLSPDERHHRLSTRTFLGNTLSHDKKFNHIIRDGHYVSEIDGRLNVDSFEREFSSMIQYINEKSNSKRVIAIGNPPYQESDGGFGKSAKAIYDLFTQRLIDSDDISEILLVIPARWFGGGKGLNAFRDLLRTSGRVKNLRYFKNSSEIFPTVDINGGVCFLHYDKSFSGKTTFTDGEHHERLHLSEFDIVSDDPKAYSLVRKVLGQWRGRYIGSVAWSRKPFGLSTDHFSKVPSLKQSDKYAIPCLSRNRQIKFVDRRTIEKNADKIDFWKVSVPAVAGGSKGNRRSTIPLNQIFIIPKGSVSTETYSVIDSFSDKNEADNLVSYLKTDFARYFLGLRKMTQHLPRDRWDWVPYVKTNKEWTDSELFQMFGITDEEQAHIKSKVKEWSC